MRITTKGQVTIPQDIREKFGFIPETEVEFCVERNKVFLKKTRTTAKKAGRGKKIVNTLKGRGDMGLSTDEIMAMTRGKS